MKSLKHYFLSTFLLEAVCLILLFAAILFQSIHQNINRFFDLSLYNSLNSLGNYFSRDIPNLSSMKEKIDFFQKYVVDADKYILFLHDSGIIKYKLLFNVVDNHTGVNYSNSDIFAKNKNICSLSERIASFRLSDGSVWRSIAKKSRHGSFSICVVRNFDNLKAMEKRMFFEFLCVFSLVVLLFVFFLNLVVKKTFIKLSSLSNKIKRFRYANYKEIDLNDVPVEVKPIIDELNELIEKFNEAIKAERRFSSDAAHELKTPLAALKTQAQVAISADDEESRNRALMNITKCVDRSVHSVQQLLVLSRLTNGILSDSPSVLDLNDIVADVVADLYFLAQEKKVDIEVINESEKIQIEGFAIAISTLVKNLVSNAIKYSDPEKGFVKIILSNIGTKAILRVIDNGHGISPEMRERVFEKFFRIVGEKSEGSGLGLNIVQQIVKLHKASIKLLTPESGKGLEVVVAFFKKLKKNEN